MNAEITRNPDGTITIEGDGPAAEQKMSEQRRLLGVTARPQGTVFRDGTRRYVITPEVTPENAVLIRPDDGALVMDGFTI